jgi:hypothetical protein
MQLFTNLEAVSITRDSLFLDDIKVFNTKLNYCVSLPQNINQSK